MGGSQIRRPEVASAVLSARSYSPLFQTPFPTSSGPSVPCISFLSSLCLSWSWGAEFRVLL